MDNHTAPELLEAVGFDWRADEIMGKWIVGDGSLKSMRELHEGHYTYCLHHATYTGPALGTPELDGILLVAGQRWCVENWDKYDDVNDALYDGNLQAINETDTFVLEWLLFYCDTPGHALARAIRDSPHA